MVNLQVEQTITATAQVVRDQNGNTSALAVSTDAVGIGTAEPGTPLHIAGVAPADANAAQLRISEPGGNFVLMGRAIDYGFVQSHNREPLAFNPIGNNVGVGTTSPAARLDVAGEVRSSGGNGGVLNVLNPRDQGANVFLGWESNVARIRVGGDGEGGANGLDIQTRGNRSLMRLAHNGNIGIGTANPQERLEVDGNILATGDISLAGADCAEEFDLEDGQVLVPGTVLVIANEDKLRQCSSAYDTKVAGVLSGAGDCKPGIILGRHVPRRIKGTL